jgi:hypothetical protein
VSKRNKLENKRIRHGTRLGMNRPDRIPVGNDLPDDLERLTDPKDKLGAPYRKMMMRARGSILIMPETVGPTRREKAVARFSRLTYRQLCRRMHQYWARAAAAHNRAEKLVAGSRFAAALNRLEQVNLALLGLCQEEIKRRSEKVTVLS